LLSLLLCTPILGIFLISSNVTYKSIFLYNDKKIALTISIINIIISFIIFILFDFNNNQFQFVQEQYNIKNYDIYLGIDGISIYFILLTTLIMPIALLSN